MITQVAEQNQLKETLYISACEGFEPIAPPEFLSGYEVDAAIAKDNTIRIIEVRSPSTLCTNGKRDLRRISELCESHEVEFELHVIAG
jgi:hypothetical protein